MIPLPRRIADTHRRQVEDAVRAERRRILCAFDELAGTYLRNAELHRATLPHAAVVEQHHADDLRRVIGLFGGVR